MKKLTNESFDLKNNTEYIRIGDYINCRTKISFLCPYCNTVWDALPKNILEGHGCFSCSYIKKAYNMRFTEKQFNEKLALLNIKHTLVGKYVGTKSKTLFRCFNCKDTWETRPDSILEGHGCPKCSVSGYKKNLPGHLYFIQINDFLKIGITNREPSLRYMQLTDTANITEIKVIYGDGNSIYDLEQLIHSKFSHYNPKSLKSGNTECFALSLKEDILLFLEKY